MKMNGSWQVLICPPIVRFSVCIILVPITVVTVFGNLLVIITIIHFKQLHTPTNFLILSLAVADLTVGAMLMPLSIKGILEKCMNTANTLQKNFNVMMCNVSVLNLSFIALDRYYAVSDPLRYKFKMTPPVTAVMITLTWSVPAVVGGVLVFTGPRSVQLNSTFSGNVSGDGHCSLTINVLSQFLFSLVFFYTPCTIMICTYLKIYLIVRRQVQAIQDQAMKNMTSKTHMLISKMERKATKTLAVVFVVFCMCWAPVFICVMIQSFLILSKSIVFYHVIGWIAYSNSMFNPLVYSFFYSWFRKALSIIVSGKIFRQNSSRMNLFSE
ncbi:trace amine-associated receptor 1-like [Denticeps clupeoides]|uniref:trace amine-associated receptor 1-like n=1 Tax=Denticeps clupeoides TaxID=299321 RepID=UPI0010A3FCD5|nr:trace amine-associated receptor 1-like [Denticeps clupeoides]